VNEGRYRVRDFWIGHRAFEIFRERFSEDLAEFDRGVIGELLERQEFVGTYYESDDDFGFELEAES
jgi:hypothetical protein